MKGKVGKLHIDPDVHPNQQPHHRIPSHVRQDLEKELERLENLDIIEKVTGPMGEPHHSGSKVLWTDQVMRRHARD